MHDASTSTLFRGAKPLPSRISSAQVVVGAFFAVVATPLLVGLWDGRGSLDRGFDAAVIDVREHPEATKRRAAVRILQARITEAIEALDEIQESDDRLLAEHATNALDELRARLAEAQPATSSSSPSARVSEKDSTPR